MPKLVAQQAETRFRTAKAGGAQYRISDGDGLYMLVDRDGSKRWRFQYTRPAGGRNTLGLGDYPTVSVAAARAARDEAHRLLSEGIDPGEHRKTTKAMQAERAANSLEAVAREWIAKFSPTWSESHASRVQARLVNDIYPWIGGRPVGEITAKDLLTVLQRMEKRGAVDTAHRVRGDLGRIFRYAVSTGRAGRDPAADLRGALPPVRPGHFAALTDPKDIARLLKAIDGYSGSLVVRSALQLAPLFFVRPGELRTARWADMDLDAGEWRYTVTKTRNNGVAEHIVPLCERALAILRELHPLTGSREYVFPSSRGEGRPMSENTVNAALRYLGYDGDTMTGHGFRAMARTVLDEVLGYPIHIIEQQLAHAVKDPLGRAYNRTAHLPQRRKMMQAWADYLDALKAENVVPFKAKAA
jgi:integrase